MKAPKRLGNYINLKTSEYLLFSSKYRGRITCLTTNLFIILVKSSDIITSKCLLVDILFFLGLIGCPLNIFEWLRKDV
jgi:hypothetical protein